MQQALGRPPQWTRRSAVDPGRGLQRLRAIGGQERPFGQGTAVAPPRAAGGPGVKRRSTRKVVNTATMGLAYAPWLR